MIVILHIGLEGNDIKIFMNRNCLTVQKMNVLWWQWWRLLMQSSALLCF